MRTIYRIVVQRRGGYVWRLMLGVVQMASGHARTSGAARQAAIAKQKELADSATRRPYPKS